jgi:flagellar protein FliO/FliZ
MNSLDSFLQLIGVLLIFVFVLFVTYLTTRWLGGYQKVHSRNKNLQIIESIHVGNNKLVSIIAAGTKYLVISVGKDEVHLLAELTKEQLVESSEGESSAEQESFQEILKKFKEKIPKKQG